MENRRNQAWNLSPKQSVKIDAKTTNVLSMGIHLRRVGGDVNTVLIAILFQRRLLQIWIHLDLIYRRHDLTPLPKQFQIVHVKIGYTNGSHFARLKRLFHICPCRSEVAIMLQIPTAVWKQGKERWIALIVHRHRPVHKPEVKVINTQPLQG